MCAAAAECGEKVEPRLKASSRALPSRRRETTEEAEVVEGQGVGCRSRPPAVSEARDALGPGAASPRAGPALAELGRRARQGASRSRAPLSGGHLAASHFLLSTATSSRRREAHDKRRNQQAGRDRTHRAAPKDRDGRAACSSHAVLLRSMASPLASSSRLHDPNFPPALRITSSRAPQQAGDAADADATDDIYADEADIAAYGIAGRIWSVCTFLSFCASCQLTVLLPIGRQHISCASISVRLIHSFIFRHPVPSSTLRHAWSSSAQAWAMQACILLVSCHRTT